MSGDLQTNKMNSRVEARVQLCILGQFGLQINGRSRSEPDNHVSKRRSIVTYLILHRERAVPQTELIETFYEDEDQSDPLAALKMQIGRIRKRLKECLGEETDAIISKRGSYQWNPALTCWVDIEAFDELCLEAELESLSTEEKISLYTQAMEIYAGDLALENDNLLWSKILSSRYHAKYIATVDRYAELLIASGRCADAESICLKAIEKDATNESLYALLIRALMEQNKLVEAKIWYNNIVDTLQKSLGVQPSEELRQLYSQCMEVKHPWEQDLSLVMEDMRDISDKQEAIFCGYEQFKHIYQLEVRRAKRDGGCLHVAMLTVLGMDGKVLFGEISDVIMERVQQVIVRSLRQSDVVAQYSACQFIIMLPYANLEDSQTVIERIINAYHTTNPRNAIRFSYQLRELELI